MLTPHVENPTIAMPYAENALWREKQAYKNLHRSNIVSLHQARIRLGKQAREAGGLFSIVNILLGPN